MDGTDGVERQPTSQSTKDPDLVQQQQQQLQPNLERDEDLFHYAPRLFTFCYFIHLALSGIYRSACTCLQLFTYNTYTCLCVCILFFVFHLLFYLASIYLLCRLDGKES